MMESGYVRFGLNTRIRLELNRRASNHELNWELAAQDDGRLLYVVHPGDAWAEPRPPTLRMTAGEAADWLNIG